MTEPAPVFTSGIDHERLTSQLRFVLRSTSSSAYCGVLFSLTEPAAKLCRALLARGGTRRVFAEYAPAAPTSTTW